MSLVASSAGSLVHRLFSTGWGFDWFYYTIIVRPLFWVARVNRSDVLDQPFELTTSTMRGFYRLLSLTQTGRLRSYVVGVAFGAIIAIAVLVFL